MTEEFSKRNPVRGDRVLTWKVVTSFLFISLVSLKYFSVVLKRSFPGESLMMGSQWAEFPPQPLKYLLSIDCQIIVNEEEVQGFCRVGVGKL